MKILFALLLLCFSAHAWSAPACLPGDTKSDRPGNTLPHVLYDFSGKGVVLYVHCDVGHRWQTVVLVTAALADIPSISDATDAIKAAVTPAQQQSLLDQVAAKATNTAYDAELRAQVMALPLPTQSPPSGLVIQDVRVYSLTRPTNASPAMTLVGSAPLGTICDATQQINGLYRIDRTKVKLPTGALMPSTAWAKCTP